MDCQHHRGIIEATETDPAIQMDMLEYLGSLQQDVCDYGFCMGTSAHALRLSYLDEGKTLLDNFFMSPCYQNRPQYRAV